MIFDRPRCWGRRSTVTRPPYDSRAIANLMLDEAGRHGRGLTNLALQKLLYFAHALFLIEHGRPLVSGYFEAWEFGPVHPVAYQAFKVAREQPITFKARRQDLATGKLRTPDEPSEPEVRSHIARIIAQYGGLSAGRLIEISHAKNAPWRFVVDRSRTGLSYGGRITDDVILSCFKHHKVAVGRSPTIGDPGEDTPPA
jgi:uncharacterized phage-associated protein